LMSHTKPHVLILDEPTSHLDIDSREALIHALNEYAGAVLLITHDVYLAEAVADRLWLVHNGRARVYDGDLNDYRKLVLDADRPKGAPRLEPVQEAAPVFKPQSAPPARKGNPTTLRHRAKKAEEAMAEAQAAILQVDAQLADSGLFSRDPAKGAALSQRRAQLEADLLAAEEAWLAANDELEQVERTGV